MIPRIMNYGNYSSKNYGASTLMVRLAGLTLWYSYDTIVAFDSCKHGFVISQNVWSTTTGKHLNWIDPDKKARVPHNQFEDLLADAMRDYEYPTSEVIIEVLGGVATLRSAPENVNVVIINYDNQEEK